MSKVFNPFSGTLDEAGVVEVVAGDGVDIDNSNPSKPIISSTRETTILKVNGGNSSTTFQDYKLRLDFGSVGGSSINPSGTP